MTGTLASVLSNRHDLGDYDRRRQANLSAWLREKTDQRTDSGGKPVMLDGFFLDSSQPSELRDEFQASGTPTFLQKADKLLRALKRASEYDGQKIAVFASEEETLAWEARAWAQNREEFETIVDYLVDEGLVDGDRGTHDHSLLLNLQLTGKGLKRVEKQQPAFIDSAQAFVAMWFNDEVDYIYDEALAPAIEGAKYEPFKINNRPPIDRLDAKIEEEIRKSRFVVADLSDHRPSVYYEAGFARALGIPVFYSCREDYFNDRHFDIAHFYCYKWSRETIDQLARELQKAIVSACGLGPQ